MTAAPSYEESRDALRDAHRCDQVDCGRNTYCDGDHPLASPVHADARVVSDGGGDLRLCTPCLSVHMLTALDPINGVTSITVTPVSGGAA
ncbi:MAG: hypothetical protein JWM93_2435 [Frankiales bacterium]|nr:hypothetical protein [Frankiales bacterium]